MSDFPCRAGIILTDENGARIVIGCDRRRESETAETHLQAHHDPETGFEWEDGPDSNADFDAAVSYLRDQRERYLAHRSARQQ